MMNNLIEKLNAFVENTENNAANITSEGRSRFDKIESYLSGSADEGTQNVADSRIRRFETESGLSLNENQKSLFFLLVHLFYAGFRWHRSEQRSGEGFLKGGFTFGGSIFSKSGDGFWKDSLKDFLQYGAADRTNPELLEKLRFIDSLTPPTDQALTPHFGCVLLSERKFPDEFYFYDSGLIMHLPFKTFEEHIEAMTASAAVCCWEYFYTNPEEVISLNKGLSYLSWTLHTDTNLGEEYKALAPVPGADKYDRLDMINEYLERCVRLLPESFPFLDFSHHRQWYEQFYKLYQLSKDKL